MQLGESPLYDLEYLSEVDCPGCEGAKGVGRKCYACKGTGEKKDHLFNKVEKCRTCGGGGHIIEKECETCKG